MIRVPHDSLFPLGSGLSRFMHVPGGGDRYIVAPRGQAWVAARDR